MKTEQQRPRRVWFVVPVFGRTELTAICLRQLSRTCEGMSRYDIDATAVVIGEDSSLDVARELGFATVRRDNSQLGRKFNDGYQLACDPDVDRSMFGPDFDHELADYVVPCGSDDWVDPVIFRQLPTNSIGVFGQIAVVNEEKTQMMRLRVSYPGGAGVRIIPRSFIEACDYRPADEDRPRAIDTSTLHGIRTATQGEVPLTSLDVHDCQIVDWKSHREQLNSYEALGGYRRGETADPFEVLSEFYPSESLEEMKALGRQAVAA